MNGEIKLYTPENALVTIPIDPEHGISREQAHNILSSVRNLLAVGFSIKEKRLDEVEQIQEVAFVERRVSADETPILDFYVAHPKATKKAIHTYLNTEEQIRAFETVSGLRVIDIPQYDGELALSKDSPKASTYIIKLPRPIKVVFSINPKWLEWKESESKDKEPIKRLVRRYEASANGNGSSPSPAPDQSKQPQRTEFEIACETLSPAGTPLGQLKRDLLEKLSVSTASNVTEEMRGSAKLILKSLV